MCIWVFEMLTMPQILSPLRLLISLLLHASFVILVHLDLMQGLMTISQALMTLKILLRSLMVVLLRRPIIWLNSH
uniref:Uncharacterized protein n=1 Tax=Arundo donax TaxID=35708 RepID=A0A0A9RGW2_ARUDO